MPDRGRMGLRRRRPQYRMLAPESETEEYGIGGVRGHRRRAVEEATRPHSRSACGLQSHPATWPKLRATKERHSSVGPTWSLSTSHDDLSGCLSIVRLGVKQVADSRGGTLLSVQL